MFYVITYVLTTLAAFGIILLLARQGHEAEEISDLAGLNQRSPLYAGVMALSMLSLAGIPPLVGFYAKLAVLQSLMSAQKTSYLVLTVFAVLASLLAAFYYLRVIKVMYFDAPQVGMPTAIVAGTDARIVLTLNGGLLLALGIAPGGLMTLCSDAIASLVKSLVN
jgi:NADH-quinone oxidoreductase subunit N